jgi:hypothetical protein
MLSLLIRFTVPKPHRFAGEHQMANWKPDVGLVIRVPTFYGNRDTIDGSPGSLYTGNVREFDEPKVPILMYESQGLRLVLGSDRADASPHDEPNLSKPDIQIERRPNGWAIFLHPEAGCDPAGVVYFHDDGRSFLLKERLSDLEFVDDTPDEIDT